MARKEAFPFIPGDLFKALSEAFPDQIPSTHDLSQADFARLVGQQEVIRFLRTKFRLQEE